MGSPSGVGFGLLSNDSYMPGESFEARLSTLCARVAGAESLEDLVEAADLARTSAGRRSRDELRALYEGCMAAIEMKIESTPTGSPFHIQLLAFKVASYKSYRGEEKDPLVLPLSELSPASLAGIELPIEFRVGLIDHFLSEVEPPHVQHAAALLHSEAPLRYSDFKSILTKFAALPAEYRCALVAALSDEAITQLARVDSELRSDIYQYVPLERLEEMMRRGGLPSSLLASIHHRGDQTSYDLILRLVIEGAVRLFGLESNQVFGGASSERLLDFFSVYSALPQSHRLILTGKLLADLWRQRPELREAILALLPTTSFGMARRFLVHIMGSGTYLGHMQLQAWFGSIDLSTTNSIILSLLVWLRGEGIWAGDLREVSSETMGELLFQNNSLVALLTDEEMALGLEGLVAGERLTYVEDQLLCYLIKRAPEFIASHVTAWDQEVLCDVIETVVDWADPEQGGGIRDEEDPTLVDLIPLARCSPALFLTHIEVLSRVEEAQPLLEALARPGTLVEEVEQYWTIQQTLLHRLHEIQTEVITLEDRFAVTPVDDDAEIHAALSSAKALNGEIQKAQVMRRNLLLRLQIGSSWREDLAAIRSDFQDTSLKAASETRTALVAAYPLGEVTKFDASALSPTLAAILAYFERNVVQVQQLLTDLNSSPSGSFGRVQVLFGSPLPRDLREKMKTIRPKNIRRYERQLERLEKAEQSEVAWMRSELSTPLAHDLFDASKKRGELGLIQRLERLQPPKSEVDMTKLAFDTFLGEPCFGGLCNIRLLEDCEEILGITYAQLLARGFGFDARASSLERLSIDPSELADVLLGRDSEEIESHRFYVYLHLDGLEEFWSALPEEIDDLDRLARHLQKEQFDFDDFA